ncbi:hypothetical protein CHT76_08380 [Listeria monocytogenes]|nr:hypothetical protein [Listeria monocytogenes]EAG8714018.1 hypothetical protein [Listeria monocytogenes]EAG8732389.1 hypothetical protein [Listeria monocytogenes]
MPWDFYLYVAISVLHWDLNYFLSSTPCHFLKQYIKHLEFTNPDALNTVASETYTMDQVPLYN